MNYLVAIANHIQSKLEASLIPDQGDPARLFRLYAVLALAKGEAVSLADVHNAWVAWMTDYDPKHTAIRPFDELDRKTALSDEPFRRAVAATARELGLGQP
jgi:hypothetical protein